VPSPSSSTPSPLSPRSLNSNQVAEDAAGRPVSPRKAGAGFFKTRRRPSLSIDTGAIPSKVKHLGATNAVGSTPVPSSIPMEKPPVNNGSKNNPLSPSSNTSNNMDDSTTITTLNSPKVNVTSPLPNRNAVQEQDDDDTHDYEYYQGDSDSGANNRKNRGEDADGKKKKSLFKGMFRRSHGSVSIVASHSKISKLQIQFYLSISCLTHLLLHSFHIMLVVLYITITIILYSPRRRIRLETASLPK
jgi:hypothetical protein